MHAEYPVTLIGQQNLWMLSKF